MTNQPSPVQQIAAGLERDDVGTQRRARRIAADFRPDPRMEHLLAMRDSRDPRWADVGNGQQLAAHMYEKQRDTAAMVNGGAA
jgi:hypothetical protein